MKSTQDHAHHSLDNELNRSSQSLYDDLLALKLKEQSKQPQLRKEQSLSLSKSRNLRMKLAINLNQELKTLAKSTKKTSETSI